MLRSRALTGALIVGAVATASLFAAAPASAATLPDGQKITVIDYFDGYGQFYEASPADAALTGVGTGQSLGEDDLTAVDVDDAGLGYAIGNFYNEDESTLFHADANTGILSSPVIIMLNFGDVQVEAEYCSALDYSAGVLMAICFDTVSEQDVAYWGILDPNGAVGEAWLTPLYQFDGQEYLDFESMAVDPVSGLVYATAYLDGPALFTLSQDAGATFVTNMDRPAYGLDFDSGGQAWATTWLTVPNGEFPYEASSLATLNLVDGSNPFVEVMTFEGDDFEDPFIQPITVWGKKTLPATGPSNTSAIGVGAAALLLLGAFLAAGTIARRRASES
jgi:LPXTG-motif cell wall-anchored protein